MHAKMWRWPFTSSATTYALFIERCRPGLEPIDRRKELVGADASDAVGL